ncbi:MAG TPA: regulatory protein RecX, partial [Gammaproteobacteria bacterium]|nr:regulatory protein RecX [Gammaproteobacteria bacterium]
MSFTGRNRKDITGDGAEKKSADKTPPVKDRALGLLARREHSAVELKRKLQQKGYNSSDIDTELSQLQRDGSLSDRRFTEAYVNMRMNRGYGPMRILAELRDRGIPAELANEYLN